MGNWGAIRFNTVPRVPCFSREKRRVSADPIESSEERGRYRNNVSPDFSDMLRENSLSGSDPPESNLSHLRTSCSHIIHHFRKNCNTFPIFFMMKFVHTSPLAFVLLAQIPPFPPLFAPPPFAVPCASPPEHLVPAAAGPSRPLKNYCRNPYKICFSLQVVHNLGV